MKGDECKERAVNLGKLMGNGFERACNIANGLDGVRKNRQDTLGQPPLASSSGSVHLY